jgi:branched-subunit amino acid aminotransferase/4-amino-4-deoxychorismate lyase
MTGVIAADDRGFTLGDGLFETLLAERGELQHLDAHLDRLAAGCGVLGLPVPDRDEATQAMRDALAAAGLGDARAAVRLNLTAGVGGRGLDRPDALRPVITATAARAVPPTGPARLVTVLVRRNDQSPASGLKTLAYLDNVLARAEARAQGADEALMLNTRGEVACGAAANIFWLDGGALCTPALACGVLPGVTRARVLVAARRLGLQMAEIRELRSALDRAPAIFLTNSLIGLRSVVDLDGRPLDAWAGLPELMTALD